MRSLRDLGRESISAIVAGGIALGLGLAAVRSESRLSVSERQTAAQQDVARLAERIEWELRDVYERIDEAADAIERGSDAEVRNGIEDMPYPVWHLRGTALEQLAGPREDATALAVSALRGTMAPVVGPVTDPRGQEVVLMQRPVHGYDTERVAVALRLEELWKRTGLLELMHSGMDVQITRDDSTQQPVFWSAPERLHSPVASEVALPIGQWELSVEPRGGWRDASTTWSRIVIVWIAAMGYALVYMLLSRKPGALAHEVERLNARLGDKSSEVSALLRSRSQLEAQLLSSLTVDVHTGLPNRATFVEHLQGRLAQARLMARGATVVAVIRFWQLEELSHSMGATFAQRFLSQAADRLLEDAASGLYLARAGERDLAVCVEGAAADAAAPLAERLLGVLDTRFLIGRQPVFSRAVVGVAVCNDGYEHAPEMLSKATLAAEAALRTQERWSLFKPEAKEERVSMLQLEADLQSAIDNHELRLHFQPIVSVAEGTIAGFESLLRWQHPTDGFIPPDRFLPLADGIGQLGRISEWCARECVAHGKQWHRSLRKPMYLTLNISPRDLNHGFVGRIFDLLSQHELPAEYLRIEITENAVVRDFRAAARVISELSDRGIKVLLDDFGTGYSSLSYLRELPFHAVKIDKSFIRGMSAEARDFGLVRSIVNLVHYLGMECVAEGVETHEQLDLVELIGCDSWQGFLFAKPVPAAEVEGLLARPSGRRLAAGGQ